MRRLTMLAATLAGAAVLAACGGDEGGGAAREGPTSPAAAASASGTPGSGDASPPGDASPSGATPSPSAANWSNGPVSVTRKLPVPPVPVLTRVRTAAHPEAGYDRIVFDFAGALPGYTVRYVDEVREDPSDRPVSMPGRRSLLIVFTPAQAHTDAGAVTVPAGTRTLDYPMLRGYAQAGDFEGYVSIALGLDDVVGFRVGELPGRIYLDVAA